MAKFLNSSGISYALENLIKKTDATLILISPYLKFNEKIKQFLHEKNLLKIDVKIIFGKENLQTQESSWLKTMDSIKILFCKNLHAKCYVNEKEAIITSMNLYDFSQQNNNEMGIHVIKEDDPELYGDVYDEVTSLIRISEYADVGGKNASKKERPTKGSRVTKKINKFTSKVNSLKKGRCIMKNDNSAILKNLIREWRTKKANETGLPSYMIISNATLDDIIFRKPRTKNELKSVKGFGDVKTAKYGDEIIKILSETS